MPLLHLQRAVVDPEGLVQQQRQLAAVRLGVAARADHDVGGERREARRDLPDVQVVHLHHVRRRRERAADLVRVEVARGGLEQHPAGVAQQAHAGPIISAATNRAATPSARANPVVRITTPATAVAMNA